MEIEVRLFAVARESAGCDTLCLQFSDRPSAADVMVALERELPQISGLIPSCRLAVNCEYVGPQMMISDDAEVALIPPVSGG